MKVTVKRGSGNNIAPDIIVDPLCNTQTVGVARGMMFLYDEGMDKQIYVITIPYRRKIYPSDIIAVHYGKLGESFVARVIQHDIKIYSENEALNIDSVLTVERSIEKN